MSKIRNYEDVAARKQQTLEQLQSVEGRLRSRLSNNWLNASPLHSLGALIDKTSQFSRIAGIAWRGYKIARSFFR